MSKFKFFSNFGARIRGSRPKVNDRLRVGGYFTFTARNKDGSIAWQEKLVPNGVTNAGLNDLLDVYFDAGTQDTTWFIGLVNNAGFTAFAAADTSASHSGWTELTDYTEATRVAWVPGEPASQSITGPAATFTINTTVAIKGAFLIGIDTKGGTTGILFATGAFGSVQNLVNAQTLDVTYTCAAASS
jgi:hypothetical protein